MLDQSLKVSIIIPSYNYGRYIEELVANLQEQTYQNWEAILVDDGSTDNTREIGERLSKTEKRLIYRRISNSGCAGARQAGLELSSGDYLQFLDADDFVSKDKLELQLAYSLRHSENTITYTDLVYFDDRFPDKHYPDFNMEGKEWMPKFDGNDPAILESLIRNNFTAVSSPMVSRKFVLENNLSFDGRLESKEDWLFWIECALANASFRYFGDKRAKTLIRRHATSLTLQTDTLQFGEVIFREKLDPIIGHSNVNPEMKLKLKQLNAYLRKWLILRIIEKLQLNNPAQVKSCIQNLGLKTTLIYLVKVLNNKRKMGKAIS